MKVKFLIYQTDGSVEEAEHDVTGFKNARELASHTIKLISGVEKIIILNDGTEFITVYED